MDFNSQEAPATASPAVQRAGNAIRAKLRRTVSTFVCDANGVGAAAIGSRLMLPIVPKGAKGVHHRITASATMGAAATLALGIEGSTGKYRAAATFTVADTPTVVAKAANLAAELAADEQQFLTVGAAALPNGGETLVVETFYTLTD